jgi:hypothetical protein
MRWETCSKPCATARPATWKEFPPRQEDSSRGEKDEAHCGDIKEERMLPLIARNSAMESIICR